MIDLLMLFFIVTGVAVWVAIFCIIITIWMEN